MIYGPSGYVKIANWKIAVEIVVLPMKHGVFPVRYVKLPEGTHINLCDTTEREEMDQWRQQKGDMMKPNWG